MNGLEALARGTPVVAPAFGAWTEYFFGFLQHLLVRVKSMEPPLPNNKIHVGLGAVADPADFAAKLVLAKSYRDEVIRQRPALRSEYGPERAVGRARELLDFMSAIANR